MRSRLQDVLVRPAARLPRHGDAPEAAVVAVVHGDPASVLFSERARVEGDPWSGDVAFPGGRRDPGDRDLRATAAREASEELGLELPDDAWLGELDELGPVSRRKPLVVRPFVAYLPELPVLRPNREVARVLHRPLSLLLADVGRGPMPFVWQGQSVTLPRVDFDGVRLWGMTLRMVDDLLHRLDGRGVGLERASADLQQ